MPPFGWHFLKVFFCVSRSRLLRTVVPLCALAPASAFTTAQPATHKKIEEKSIFLFGGCNFPISSTNCDAIQSPLGYNFFFLCFSGKLFVFSVLKTKAKKSLFLQHITCSN